MREKYLSISGKNIYFKIILIDFKKAITYVRFSVVFIFMLTIYFFVHYLHIQL